MIALNHSADDEWVVSIQAAFAPSARSIRRGRNPPRAIAHPVQVLISSYYPSSRNTGKGGIHFLSASSAEGVYPFVNFGMTIGKSEARCPIMVGGRLVNPRCHVGIEETCVVDAARMLI